MKRVCLWMILALGIVGCLADDNDDAPRFFLQQENGGDEGAEDTVTVEPDTEGEGLCEGPDPESVGTGLGDTFDVFKSLTNCDGEKVQLLDLMCGKKLTFVDISAGWCQPCKEQAETLDEEIYEPFKDQGLQVISIIFEDPDGYPATSSYCQVWRDTFSLTSSVLVDPALIALKQQFVDAGNAAPINLLLDEDFKIIYIRSGENPSDLVETIEAELAK